MHNIGFKRRISEPYQAVKRSKMKYIYSYTENTFALRELNSPESPNSQIFEDLQKYLSSFSNVTLFLKRYVSPDDGYYCIGENKPNAFQGVTNPQFPQMLIITVNNTNVSNNDLHASTSMTMQCLLNKIKELKNKYELQEGAHQDFYSSIFQDFFFEEANPNIKVTPDYRPTKQVAKPFLTAFDLFTYKSSAIKSFTMLDKKAVANKR